MPSGNEMCPTVDFFPGILKNKYPGNPSNIKASELVEYMYVQYETPQAATCVVFSQVGKSSESPRKQYVNKSAEVKEG